MIGKKLSYKSIANNNINQFLIRYSINILLFLTNLNVIYTITISTICNITFCSLQYTYKNEHAFYRVE